MYRDPLVENHWSSPSERSGTQLMSCTGAPISIDHNMLKWAIYLWGVFLFLLRWRNSELKQKIMHQCIWVTETATEVEGYATPRMKFSELKVHKWREFVWVCVCFSTVKKDLKRDSHWINFHDFCSCNISEDWNDWMDEKKESRELRER